MSASTLDIWFVGGKGGGKSIFEAASPVPCQ
jgi:hypothetical protein